MKGFKPTGKGPISGHHFPGHFGFHGSNGMMRSVRPYTRKAPAHRSNNPKHRYDEGGQVNDSEMRSLPPAQTGRKASPGFGGAIKDFVSSVSDAIAPKSIKERKSRTDEAVSDADNEGKARGGRMKRMGYKEGGEVGNSVVKRGNPPITEFDKEYGGRGPLRSGFKRGGKLKKSIGGIAMKKGGKVHESPRHLPGGSYAKGGHFIAKAIKRPGALHQATHTPKGQKIPHAKIEKAEHSKNPRIRKEANFAETLASVRPHKASGGKMKRMGYKEGGGVSKTEAKHIAERTVGEHVRYPAPKGHKGFERMPMFGGHGK